MLVYHGSNALFDTFDYQKIGTNATDEGKGFYFTNNIQIARGYAHEGYLYTVEFSGKKSLSSTSKTITKEQLRHYLLRLHTSIDYLSNWDDVSYRGLPNVLHHAVDSEYEASDNDVDLIAGIINLSGSAAVSLQVLYEMFEYDSIIVDAKWGNQCLYIALVNAIIQIVDVQPLR